jgi:DNA transformation protein
LAKSEFAVYTEEMLEDFAPLTIRAMFGGYGIYKDGIIFALIIDNELYFKGSDLAAQFYTKYNSSPFTYSNKNNKIVTMNYWRVPAEILENKEKIAKWFDTAWQAATSAAKK